MLLDFNIPHYTKTSKIIRIIQLSVEVQNYKETEVELNTLPDGYTDKTF